MNLRKPISKQYSGPADAAARDCANLRSGFSAYLDGAMSGVEMAAISAHLEGCGECDAEFAVWRDVQRSLGGLGPASPPTRLQNRLREALAVERERGSHLSLPRKAQLFWRKSLASLAVPIGGGVTAALVLAGGLTWLFAAPLAAVEASDSPAANLVAPRYLYSEVPPLPMDDRRDVPVVVEALVDSQGRVYDYSILEGPRDSAIKVRVEGNLLSSIFQPATVFGVPVRGHVVVTYTGVSVRG
jgi:hypothetical protein